MEAYTKRFNHDLLMSTADLDYARSQFPAIYHVLDFPELRAKFKIYEDEANTARSRVRLLGFLVIVAATLSLLSSVTQPYWPHATWTKPVALLIELAGLLAAIIAGFGLARPLEASLA